MEAAMADFKQSYGQGVLSGPPNLYLRGTAGVCICGKHMLERANEGTCLWCGHGQARYVVHDQAWGRLAGSAPIAALDARVVPLSRARSHAWDEDSCVTAYRAWEREHGRAPRSTDWAKGRLPGEHRPNYRDVSIIFGGWKGFLKYVAEVPREEIA